MGVYELLHVNELLLTMVIQPVYGVKEMRSHLL